MAAFSALHMTPRYANIFMLYRNERVKIKNDFLLNFVRKHQELNFIQEFL